MKIWLLTTGEPLPTDCGEPRLYRCGLLARALAHRGHDVLWWTSDFDHFTKKHRFGRDTEIKVSEGLRLKLLSSPGYKKNISLNRLWDHYLIARRFRAQAQLEAKPDLIVSSYPTIDLCRQAGLYGKALDVPVVIDIRDFWPDVFEDLVPLPLRPILHCGLSPLRWMAARTLRSASFISGITSECINWGVELGQRKRSPLDKDFPLGYPEEVPAEAACMEASRFWASHGITKDEFVCCFFGSIGPIFDFDMVITTAEILLGRKCPVRIVLCGQGSELPKLKFSAKRLPNLLVPGWVNYPHIYSLMQISSVGLAPYRPFSGFGHSIPNKPIEYMSAGLPVLSSLQTGPLSKLIEKHHCGLTYCSESAEALADALQFLYEHPEQRKLMSDNARMLFDEKFKATVVYGQMSDYMEDLVRNSKASYPSTPSHGQGDNLRF